jgi:hypothetical protein
MAYDNRYAYYYKIWVCGTLWACDSIDVPARKSDRVTAYPNPAIGSNVLFNLLLQQPLCTM